MSRVMEEQALLSELNRAKNDLNSNIYEVISKWEGDARRVFSEGGKLLGKYGKIMEKSCSAATKNIHTAIVSKMFEAGLDIGRMKSSDAIHKMHRKITLNSNGLSPFVQLCNGDLTMVNIAEPLEEPFFSSARASEGPWPVRRTDRPFVRDSVDNAINEIKSSLSIKAIQIISILAATIDLVHPPSNSTQQLQSLVHSRLSAATLAIEERLRALGYFLGDISLNTFQGKDSEVKSWCLKVLAQIDDRLGMHGRFYFEVHPHVNELGTTCDWIVGVNWSDHSEAKLEHEHYPGETAYRYI